MSTKSLAYKTWRGDRPIWYLPFIRHASEIWVSVPFFLLFSFIILREARPNISLTISLTFFHNLLSPLRDPRLILHPGQITNDAIVPSNYPQSAVERQSTATGLCPHDQAVRHTIDIMPSTNKPIFVATHPRACSTAFERVRTLVALTCTHSLLLTLQHVPYTPCSTSSFSYLTFCLVYLGFHD